MVQHAIEPAADRHLTLSSDDLEAGTSAVNTEVLDLANRDTAQPAGALDDNYVIMDLPLAQQLVSCPSRSTMPA